MSNRYFKLYTDTQFAGTSEAVLYITDGTNLEFDHDEVAYELFDSYGYLIHGWGEEDPTDEEIERFVENCTVDLEEISEEEFNELADNGWCIFDNR